MQRLLIVLLLLSASVFEPIPQNAYAKIKPIAFEKRQLALRLLDQSFETAKQIESYGEKISCYAELAQAYRLLDSPHLDEVIEQAKENHRTREGYFDSYQGEYFKVISAKSIKEATKIWLADIYTLKFNMEDGLEIAKVAGSIDPQETIRQCELPLKDTIYEPLLYTIVLVAGNRFQEDFQCTPLVDSIKAKAKNPDPPQHAATLISVAKQLYEFGLKPEAKTLALEGMKTLVEISKETEAESFENKRDTFVSVMELYPFDRKLKSNLDNLFESLLSDDIEKAAQGASKAIKKVAFLFVDTEIALSLGEEEKASGLSDKVASILGVLKKQYRGNEELAEFFTNIFGDEDEEEAEREKEKAESQMAGSSKKPDRIIGRRIIYALWNYYNGDYKRALKNMEQALQVLPQLTNRATRDDLSEYIALCYANLDPKVAVELAGKISSPEVKSRTLTNIALTICFPQLHVLGYGISRGISYTSGE